MSYTNFLRIAIFVCHLDFFRSVFKHIGFSIAKSVTFKDLTAVIQKTNRNLNAQES